MTFMLWAALAATPVGLIAGWLGSVRLARYLGGTDMRPGRSARGGRWRPRHPAVMGVLAAGCVGLGVTEPAGDWAGWSQSLLLWCGLLPLAWIDLRTMLVDMPWLVGVLALRLLSVSLLDRALLPSMLLGLLVAAGFFHVLDVVYETLRGRRGLGDGDAAMAGLVGAFVGAEGILPVIGLAALTGLLGGGAWLLISRRGLAQPIPFAPSLALAGGIVYLANRHGWPLWSMSGLHF